MKKQLRLLMLTLLCAVFSTAWGEEYKLTITAEDFNSTSYAYNNNEKTTNAISTSDQTKSTEVSWVSNQVMLSSSVMQWKKSEGAIYNMTDLGTIKSVNITSTAGTFTTYYGTSVQPTSGTTAGNGFFQIKVGSATGKTSKIEITFEIIEYAVATPTFTVSAGNYHVAQSVEISCTTSGATLRYTTNGDEPTESSTEYTGAITVDRNLPLKAKAFKDDDASATASAEYTFSPVKPTLSPVGGSYQTQQNVTISCETSGATIKYFLSNESLDNPTDDQFVNEYNNVAIPINETKFLYVKAFKANWNSSELVKTKYTILRTPTPLGINSNYFVKVTDVNDLVDGDAILIVNEENNQALSTTQSTSNRRGTSVNISNSCINGIREDVQKIVLLKESNYWYFYVENSDNDPSEGYLYAASSTSNQLKTEAVQDDNDNAKAAINVADGGYASVVFQGTNTNKYLRFNPNNGNSLFSCYGGSASQKPIQIYKEVLPVTIGSTGYATLYYSDKAFMVPEGVTAITYKTDGQGKIVRSKEYKKDGGDGTFIPQGEAVVLKGTPGTYTFVATTATTECDANNALRGFDTSSQTTAPTDGNYYFYKLAKESPTAADNTVGFYWGADNGAAFEIPAHKAYLVILQSEFEDEVTQSFVFDETVGINKVQKDALSAEGIYTLSGIRINGDNLPKGIYIVNGKKIVIK